MKLTAKVAAATAVVGLVTMTAAADSHGATPTRGAVPTTTAATATTVVAEAVRIDGSEHAEVSEQAATAGNATQPRVASTPASCADGAYTLSGYKVNATIAFGYNPAGAPAAIAKTAGTAVRSSLLTVAAGGNRCKLTHPVKAASTWTGASTHAPQVSPAGTCTGNDGVNVVGWGALPTGYLAITCIYYAGGKVQNADTRVSNCYH